MINNLFTPSTPFFQISAVVFLKSSFSFSANKNKTSETIKTFLRRQHPFQSSAVFQRFLAGHCLAVFYQRKTKKYFFTKPRPLFISSF